VKAEDIRTLAVLGAGDMGHGVAEVALIHGYRVFLRDIDSAAVDKGVGRIRASLGKLVEKGKVARERFEEIEEGLLVPCVDLDEAVREADLVVEAIPEEMKLKKETFAAVDAAAPGHAILSSNTSTMSITEIAKATSRPEKVLGLHYSNPAVLMKLVEVIEAERTSGETLQAVLGFVERTGKVAVHVRKDVPGFVFNRVQAPAVVLLGCWLDAGVEPEVVDATVRSLGVPMGPYETIDFAGIDVGYNASRYFAETIHPDFAPGRVISEKVRAGEFGKKSGKGLFDWSAGRPAIDLGRASSAVDPMDLLAVNANEAMRIVEMGVCSAEDVDTAIIHGTGNPMGLIGMIRGIEPADLAARLNGLAERYGKEIFRPTRMIQEGAYR
jgi:enoyl-CoA hydratase/3-hydroxyacyl-CoA dehydrogenase